MDDLPENQPVDPGLVRYLRLLVTILSAVMIVGFLVLMVLFVTRFSGPRGPALPDQVILPDGTEPLAYTRGDGWYAVVTRDNRILIFDAQTGELRQSVMIETGQ